MSNADLAVWTQPYYWVKAKLGSIISRFTSRLEYLADDEADASLATGFFDISMPSPTERQLASHDFQVIWDVIKSWDVNVPEYYEGYCGANGSHVALILNALYPVDLCEAADEIRRAERKRDMETRVFTLNLDDSIPVLDALREVSNAPDPLPDYADVPASRPPTVRVSVGEVLKEVADNIVEVRESISRLEAANTKEGTTT